MCELIFCRKGKAGTMVLTAYLEQCFSGFNLQMNYQIFFRKTKKQILIQCVQCRSGDSATLTNDQGIKMLTVRRWCLPSKALDFNSLLWIPFNLNQVANTCIIVFLNRQFTHSGDLFTMDKKQNNNKNTSQIFSSKYCFWNSGLHAKFQF